MSDDKIDERTSDYVSILWQTIDDHAVLSDRGACVISVPRRSTLINVNTGASERAHRSIL